MKKQDLNGNKPSQAINVFAFFFFFLFLTLRARGKLVGNFLPQEIDREWNEREERNERKKKKGLCIFTALLQRRRGVGERKGDFHTYMW